MKILLLIASIFLISCSSEHLSGEQIKATLDRCNELGLTMRIERGFGSNRIIFASCDKPKIVELEDGE